MITNHVILDNKVTGLEVSCEKCQGDNDQRHLKVDICFAITVNTERENNRMRPNIKQPLCLYSLYAILKSFLILQCTIQTTVHDLAQHQPFSYQFNYDTSSNIKTPDAAIVLFQIMLPLSRSSSTPSPLLLTSMPLCNTISFEHIPLYISYCYIPAVR